ncbi:MAG TPA: DUF1697 domain-containing protein [Thermoanaerobaculia bacterium]|nr:DUF1697 domain-containing protein [Thermoanaerobaculia bacterium]
MRYVAFLRAINVGGHIVRMDALRQHFETIGMKNVETFIQSGNVLFDASARPATLERRIEAHLEEALHYRVATLIRTAAEIDDILKSQPFDQAEIDAGARLYIGFMRQESSPEIRAAFLKLRSPGDDLHIRGREIYWLCRTSFSDSPLGGPIIEKTLKTEVTMRSSTTVRKIAAKLGGAS